MHTKDQFGGFGGSGRLNGVVNIGGIRLRPTAKTRTTTESPKTTIRSPSPSIFIADNNNNRNVAVNKNQDDDSSLTKAGIKIIRQEQDATENGYHYL